MTNPLTLIDIQQLRDLDPYFPQPAPYFSQTQEHEDQVECGCSDCNHEGGWYVTTGYDTDGCERGYFETCPSCEGRGGGWVDAQPITLEDLEEMI